MVLGKAQSSAFSRTSKTPPIRESVLFPYRPTEPKVFPVDIEIWRLSAFAIGAAHEYGQVVVSGQLV
jgi:hypothetical protein